jgi:hypothetical protein
MKEEHWIALFDTLRDNPQNKIKKWDFEYQGIGPTIAKSLAAYVGVSASLTSLDLGANKLGADVARPLRQPAVRP